MVESVETNELAAEYVIGTLSHGERRQVAAARVNDAHLEEAITDWEFRLAPLADAIPGIHPAEGLLPKITKRIDAATVTGMVPAYWRGFALAASLALVIGIGMLAQQPAHAPAPQFYAALQKDAAGPLFLISFDEGSSTLTVRTVAAQPPAGKNYELWLVADGAAPKSMGVVNADDQKSIHMDKTNAASIENAAYAISVEPEGGSPTGAPTGPVVYSGKLLRKI